MYEYKKELSRLPILRMTTGAGIRREYIRYKVAK
jgi:hypothetical protein